MTTKGSNKEHIGSQGGNTAQGNGGHDPIKGDDGRLDFTKSGKAYQIFDEMHKKDKNVARKDCLDRAVNEADMTPASAATFYQKWRDDNGMVHRDDDAGRSNNGNSTQPVSVASGGTTKVATASTAGGTRADGAGAAGRQAASAKRAAKK